jgi:hypothetical protein
MNIDRKLFNIHRKPDYCLTRETHGNNITKKHCLMQMLVYFPVTEIVTTRLHKRATVFGIVNNVVSMNNIVDESSITSRRRVNFHGGGEGF